MGDRPKDDDDDDDNGQTTESIVAWSLMVRGGANEKAGRGRGRKEFCDPMDSTKKDITLWKQKPSIFPFCLVGSFPLLN